MRPALAAFVLLAATACGATSRPAGEMHWPAGARSTRAHWYRSLRKTPVAPVTLGEGEAKSALGKAAARAGVALIETRYERRAGGSAELVVEPRAPRRFAEDAATRLTPLIQPLTRGDHGYLVAVVDTARRPLLVLGWTPAVGGGGEGIAWEADGVHSSAVIGRPVTRRLAGDRVMAGPAIP